MSQILPVVSLFSGSGGLDEGFVGAGFSPVLALDIDRAACETFDRNHPRARVLRKDLSQAVNGYVIERLSELPSPVRPIGVIGGPPCQAFSLGNVHKRSDDPRLKLPGNYAHILAELNEHYGLDFFVFENVLGLKRLAHSERFTYFKGLFSSAGFTIFEGELDAQDFGVAQVRKRIFVVGFNNRKYKALQFEFPKGNPDQRKTVGEIIGKLPPPAIFERGMRSENVPFHPNHWCMKPKSKKFFNGFLKEGDIKGRPFRVLDWDKPSWTAAYGHRGDCFMRNPIAVVFTTAILVCTLFAPTLFAHQNGCTMANVAGTYGYVGFGTVRAGNPLGLPAGTYSSMGTLTFDGKGNLLIIDTDRIDDFFLPPDSQYPSTYTVNKQCVVTFTVTAWAEAGLPGPHFKGVFVANRNKLVATSLLPGANINYVNTTKIVVDDQN